MPASAKAWSGGVDAARQLDRAGGVLDDKALEVERGAVDGGEAHAEVVGQSAQEEPRQAAFAQVAGQAGGREVVVLQKRGVGVDLWRESPCAGPARRAGCRARDETPRRACSARSGRARGFAGRRARRCSDTASRRGARWQTRCARRGCQSCVIRTCGKARASALTTGTISSPPAIPSAPPGQKSFCRSTTSSASVG